MTSLNTAQSYLRAGLCVLPAIVAEKRPALPAWRTYQGRLPTEKEVQHWFAQAGTMCLVAGKISGNLEMLDFDLGGEAFQPWWEQVARADPVLLNRLVVEQSPSGGWHVAYRCQVPIAGNLRLAQRRQEADGPAEVTIAGKAFKPRKDCDDRWHVLLTLIETRGEGGLFLCAPTPGYELLQGEFSELPVLSEAEREVLLAAARAMNQHLPVPATVAKYRKLTLKISESSGQDGEDGESHHSKSKGDFVRNEVTGQDGGDDEESAMSSNGLSLHAAPTAALGPACASDVLENRPGDDFNRRGDVRDVLKRHGWTLVKPGDNEYWRRPGKSAGWSATLKDGVFYCFSGNASPFNQNQAYGPFAVFSLLEHGGDYALAAAALRSAGYGETPVEAADVDLSGIVAGLGSGSGKIAAAAPEHPDPGPLPPEFCRVPGFISEVMDHCLATAPYPNVPLAFCGALALQAVLAGRKVRDQADNRSNLYILALAYSAVGKDWPRKVNTCVLHRVGLVESLGERFASGEGIQDSLFRTPAMLFQTDEIDGLLQSINKSHDARHENILGTLLTMYSASNSIFPMRRKAGSESSGVIDQPCLVVYGTAIPTHYYGALSERMLTNGFFARMIIVESGVRSAGQDPGIIDPPQRVMATASWWAGFSPGTGNLAQFHPQPRIVEADDDARVLLTEARHASEAEYAAAEARGDAVGTTVWGRVPEQIRKLALLYAVSASHESPQISGDAVCWATKFIQHQTRRMLFMAHSHVAENPFHAECLKLIRKLQEAPDGQLPHSVLLKRMKIDAKACQELIATLEQQGDLQTVQQTTGGRPQRAYRLAR